MDYNQVLRALTEESAAKSSSASVPIWQVALTASMVAATASFFLFANLYVSLFVWICIFVVANADPMQDDSALGALARILGHLWPLPACCCFIAELCRGNMMV